MQAEEQLIRLLFPDTASMPDRAQLDTAINEHPWLLSARALRKRLTAQADSRLPVFAPFRAECSLFAEPIDVEALTTLSAEELIDRFLQEEDLRIVANEGEVVEDVLMEPDLDDEDELVSEPLAEIYAAQGLYDRAIAIYRKLSLLNSEKSIYFAELIDALNKKKKNNN